MPSPMQNILNILNLDAWSNLILKINQQNGYYYYAWFFWLENLSLEVKWISPKSFF